jgi:hypothetical protein
MHLPHRPISSTALAEFGGIVNQALKGGIAFNKADSLVHFTKRNPAPKVSPNHPGISGNKFRN